MMNKIHSAAVTLVLGLAAIAASMPFTGADPSKIITGDVFGPGGNVSPGPTNPANAANATFYSTSNTAFALLSHPDIDDADGINAASYAWDVGASWDWLVGDEVVVVVETVTGVNGWTGASLTTSSDGILASGGVIQEFTFSALEPYPTLSSSMGMDYANVSWSGMADINGNIVSYSVFRGSSPTGPFSFLATVSKSLTTMSYNDTGLGSGQFCYVLGVNYRRDTSGGIYTTIGRSQPVCENLPPPWIVSTNPASGVGGIAVTAPVIITFSETMNTGSVTWSINPSVVLTSGWTVGDTVLTLSHAIDFTQATSYTVEILTGMDLDGNSLVAGPAPNPWSFTTTTPEPIILSTSPANSATMVKRDAKIIVTFSEPMATGTVTNSSTPSVTLISTWSGGDTVLTLTPAVPLAAGTRYDITITGDDLDGNALIAGPVPNPWFFTTNNPPTVTILDPIITGSCYSGGAAMTIRWQMSDTETAASNLKVWLNYTPTLGTIAGPLSGLTSPATYQWSTPTLNEPVTILIDVADGAGEVDSDISVEVEIDSTAPTATLAQPSPGASSVATDTPLIFTFSESMNRTATEGALLFNPAATSVAPTWSNDNQTLTVGHAPFQVSTLYTVTLGTAAKDACNPGLGLAADYQATFTTGIGPRAPKPPTNLAATVSTTAVTLAWVAPTQYTDNSILSSADIANYNVYRSATLTGAKSRIGQPNQLTFTDSNVEAGKKYYYWVTAVVANSVESDYSAVAEAQLPAPPGGGLDWIWIAIPIIVILLIIGLVLLMRRKKPEEEAAPPPEEAAPSEEAPPPAEEATPPPEEAEPAPPGPEDAPPGQTTPTGKPPEP